MEVPTRVPTTTMSWRIYMNVYESGKDIYIISRTFVIKITYLSLLSRTWPRSGAVGVEACTTGTAATRCRKITANCSMRSLKVIHVQVDCTTTIGEHLVR
jgi:hypothetical protein